MAKLLARAGLLLFWLTSPSLAETNKPLPTPMLPDSYIQPAVQQMVRLVNDAAGLVDTEGERAFTKFRAPGRWFPQAEGLYLFVFDLDANQVVNAAFPELEKNRLDWRDAWGKPLFQLAIAKLSPDYENRRFWWVHYLWYKPGESTPSWKSTYMVRARAPSGKVYVVAAGLYDLATEPLWVELLVDDAMNLTRQIGAQAYSVISSRMSQFMYRNTYVFVLDEQGNELANAAFPELNGKNLLTLPDFPLKDLIADEIRFAKENGQGWMSGSWPLPGEAQPTSEEIYLNSMVLQGRLHIFGSAIYANEMASKSVTH